VLLNNPINCDHDAVADEEPDLSLCFVVLIIVQHYFFNAMHQLHLVGCGLEQSKYNWAPRNSPTFFVEGKFKPRICLAKDSCPLVDMVGRTAFPSRKITTLCCLREVHERAWCCPQSLCASALDAFKRLPFACNGRSSSVPLTRVIIVTVVVVVIMVVLRLIVVRIIITIGYQSQAVIQTRNIQLSVKE
jgi:hypothetical protein